MKVKIREVNDYMLYVKNATKGKKAEDALKRLILKAFQDGIDFANNRLKVEK